MTYSEDITNLEFCLVESVKFEFKNSKMHPVIVLMLASMTIGFVNCQTLTMGRCPNIDAKKDFDLAKVNKNSYCVYDEIDEKLSIVFNFESMLENGMSTAKTEGTGSSWTLD